MLAAQILRAEPGLVLLQYANDLFFAEPASLHRLSPQLENRLTSNRGLFRGAGQPNTLPYGVETRCIFQVFTLCVLRLSRPESEALRTKPKHTATRKGIMEFLSAKSQVGATGSRKKRRPWLHARWEAMDGDCNQGSARVCD